MMARPWLERVTISGVLALGLLCVLMGGRMLIADVNAFQAGTFLQDWATRQAPPSERAWQVAESAAQRAVRWSPVADSTHYDRLGVVSYWHDQHRLYGDEAGEASRLAALDAYRKAIELRPLWPHAYVRIAETKLALLQFDAEFDAALQQAVALGPWRASVHERVAHIGITAWHELSDAQRDLVRESYQRASENSGAARRLRTHVQGRGPIARELEQGIE